MTTHFITFATNDYQLAARDLARSACEIGGFEKSTIFGLDSVDDGFKKRNADIFNYPSNKGIGYYIWKPYVVFHHILTVAENDLVCYCDALYLFKNNIIDDLDRWMAGNPIPLAIAENKPNEAAVPEAFVSKGDAFHLMNAQPVGNQAWAGFLSFRRNSLVTQFLGEWLARVQDVRVVSDSPSITANHPGFFANRYDQTVLSILAKRWGISFFHFPRGPLQNNRMPF